ncbi:hypothetical protein [Robbsia sp. KACC 23696]|uniref:hypothetical protein n=1 Tax=Robbsia sp. KACC 23696 TaxID=3149231 RepID=UPI00325B88FB
MCNQETMEQFSALLEAYENVVLAWTTKDGNTEILPARDALRDFVVSLATSVSTTQPVVDERAAFEKGLSARYVAPNLTRNGEAYEDFDIQGAWMIYTAARRAAGVAPLIDYKAMYETAERLRVENYETIKRMQAERNAAPIPTSALGLFEARTGYIWHFRYRKKGTDAWEEVDYSTYAGTLGRGDYEHSVIGGPEAPVQSEIHPDDIAIDSFARALRAKMAESRAKGRSGWEECPTDDLSYFLREHVEKGDPRDVGIYCAMLYWKRSSIAGPATGKKTPVAWTSQKQLDIGKGMPATAVNMVCSPGRFSGGIPLSGPHASEFVGEVFNIALYADLNGGAA